MAGDAAHDGGDDADTESVYEQLSVGDRTVTQGRTVTDADVMNFAGVSGDFNHVHTDADAMAESSFGEPIVHGAFVFSAMTGLLWQNRSKHERDAVVAFYGVDRLRFTAPTFVGDTIHVEIEVVEKEPSDHPVGNGVVSYDAEVVKGDGTTVLSCQLKSLLM